MIESDVLGAAAGVQNKDSGNKLNNVVMPALVCSVVIGCFKRGRMDKPFKVTADTYKALLGDDPFNPSYTVVDDAFIAGASEIMVVRVGSLVSASVPVEPDIDLMVNNVGVQGTSMFAVGLTDILPLNMSEMEGTAIKGHENYGNYQYTDGSVMVYVPLFYYRWGGVDSPRYAKYGANALDVKSKQDFADVAEANAAGYAVHRAFYDDGQIKDGFFVDKYQASNNGGIASSVKNGIPLSSSSDNAPFSSLTGSPSDALYGAIDAVKTRGASFFPATIFIQRALSLLSMAHAQAATSSAACAWYDATDVNNFPKGCNNNALRDVNDTTVTYVNTGYSNAGKTGSAKPFAKTTHNGQDSGIADLNGNMWEVALGLTQTDGKFYLLKTTAKASALTSGATLATDAWGTAAMATNYESLGASFGEMSGESRSFAIGSTTKQVFSNANSGLAWSASCAGIPQLGGSDGANIFGNDRFYDNRVKHLSPFVGGAWSNSTNTGVWAVYCNDSRTSNYDNVGVRAALYPV